jgi:hypothetical protein
LRAERALGLADLAAIVKPNSQAISGQLISKGT